MIKQAIFFLCLYLLAHVTAQKYNIGIGIYDITGPAAEIGMMGYAMVNQHTSGLHIRLRARAFIVDDGLNNRTVYVSIDTCFCSQAVKLTVIQRLQALYGSLYTVNNVMISGTHTHSGPAGYSWYPLYDITSFGFHEPNFEVIVNGIVKAISKAHSNVVPGTIRVNTGLLDSPLSNINRSPSAYLNNPALERAKYPWNVDKDFTVLRFDDLNGKELGMIAFFAVHGTSMNNTNTLISGDNKGYASLKFEELKNGKTVLPGKGPFVAAFGQSNEGDVTPNTKGAFCENGMPCEVAHSTCNGYSQGCHGYGPGQDDFESTKIIGTHQLNLALELYSNTTRLVTGSIGYRHTYVNMENVTVSTKYTGLPTPVFTCIGALGDSFAGGTTDGPGDFNFRQGSNSTSDNPFWNFIAGTILAKPPPEQVACSSPKPILLYTGGIDFPVRWTAGILPLQVFKWGNFYLVAVPGEFTTMSGRRLRNSVKEILASRNLLTPDTVVVIAGLANTYSHYIATTEEYHIQRYEGASTLFGPYTLNAYQQEYSKLVEDLLDGNPTPHGPNPPDISSDTWDFQPPVLVDSAGGAKFGDVYTQPNDTYQTGELVTVVFISANPRNNFRTEDTFLTVEKLQGDGLTWKVVYNDGNWETKYKWSRSCTVLPSPVCPESHATIEWDTTGAQTGIYRISHFGNSKSLLGTISPFSGTSKSFKLV